MTEEENILEHQCNKAPKHAHIDKDISEERKEYWFYNKWVLNLDDDNTEVFYCPFCGVKLT